CLGNGYPLRVDGVHEIAIPPDYSLLELGGILVEVQDDRRIDVEPIHVELTLGVVLAPRRGVVTHASEGVRHARLDVDEDLALPGKVDGHDVSMPSHPPEGVLDDRILAPVERVVARLAFEGATELSLDCTL